MTTASVKDVSTVMSAPAVGNGAASAEHASFQDLWANRSDKGLQGKVTEKSTAAKNTNHQEAALKARERVRREVTPRESAKSQREEPDAQEITEDKLEEAMAVLGSAAGQLMQEIADTFGMTVEELEALMQELGMTSMDILDPEQLSALLLQAGGAQDSFSLLTDEELYGDFTALLDRQKAMLTEAAGELEISPEQLEDLAAQMADEQGTETAEPSGISGDPVIEVTVEDDEPVGEPVQLVAENPGTVQNQEPDAQSGAQEMGQRMEGREDRRQSLRSSGEETGNLAFQNLRAESSTQTQAAASVTGSERVWSADTENLMRQIMDYMRIQVGSEVSDLEMQLHPAHLGTLRIHVTAQSGVLTANFVTENEAVKAALESNLLQLKESFAEQGVKVEAIEVTVQTHQFESNLEQGRGREQEEPAGRSRARRIRLNADPMSQDLAEMTQEEEVAGELLTASGSTVNYTA